VDLQDQLDAFRTSYNRHRPHRALHRDTPLHAFSARINVGPEIAQPLAHHRSAMTAWTSPDRSPSITSAGSATSAWASPTAASQPFSFSGPHERPRPPLGRLADPQGGARRDSLLPAPRHTLRPTQTRALRPATAGHLNPSLIHHNPEREGFEPSIRVTPDTAFPERLTGVQDRVRRGISYSRDRPSVHCGAAAGTRVGSALGLRWGTDEGRTGGSTTPSAPTRGSLTATASPPGATVQCPDPRRSTTYGGSRAQGSFRRSIAH
jgi:hypothetical protein